MFGRYLRFWPIPAALAVCGVVATCAGTASHWGRGQKNAHAVVAAAPANASVPAAKPAPAAPSAVFTGERRRANLVFLVDTSARMNAPGKIGTIGKIEKMPLVQRTLLETVEFLDTSDRVSIVAYAGDARVLLPSTPVSNRAAIIQVINGLANQVQGAPGGAAGLALAYAQAARAFVTGGINHVLLCTDEGFRTHAGDSAAFAQLVRDNRKSGVTLTVLGYGVGALGRETAERLGQVGASVPPPISDDTQMHRYVRERLLSVTEDGALPRI